VTSNDWSSASKARYAADVRAASRAAEYHGLINTADRWRDHGNAFLAGDVDNANWATMRNAIKRWRT
jgi:hypothetical protein